MPDIMRLFHIGFMADGEGEVDGHLPDILVRSETAEAVQSWDSAERSRSRIRDRQGMLELRGQGPILRHGGPTVVEPSRQPAGVDHRLDGEEHPQKTAFAGATEMHDIRRIVEDATEAMTAEIRNDRISSTSAKL